MNDKDFSPAKPGFSRRQFWMTPTVGIPAAAMLAATAVEAQAPAQAPATAAAPAAATPAPVGPQRIGIIEIQGALFNTKDGQKAAADLESKMGAKKKELDQRQIELRDLQEKLTRGENTMSESAKQELARNIDAKDKNYKREMEDAQAELDEAKRKIFDELSQKMKRVLDTYASEHGYSLLMDVSNPNTPIVWAANNTNITKDIIDLYDRMQPPAPTSAPAPKAPAVTPPKPPASTPIKK